MKPEMKPNQKFIIKTSCGLFFMFFYCEFVIYYIVQSKCTWPNLIPENDEQDQDPVKVMVIADTHLLGSRRGHWFDKLRREWQMYRAFQTAMTIHKPELVFVLGDLTDEGLYCSSAEFENYVNRFYHLFEVPEGTKLYVAVGNHDIGFHYGVSPFLNERFVTAFNAPAVQLISVRGNHFVLVNSMALEGDGCFLCKPAEQQLTKIEKILRCTKGTYSSKCTPNMKLDIYSKPILMQHYPLYRQSDAECSDFDAAPYPVKQERFRERWECLSREATLQILKQVQPRLAVSGHTHHGCTRPLPAGDGVEVTVPSFSWRNKDNPNYLLVYFGVTVRYRKSRLLYSTGLVYKRAFSFFTNQRGYWAVRETAPTFQKAVFTPSNYAYTKCELPRESTVINLYIFGVTVLIFWTIYHLKCGGRRRYKYN